MTPASRAVVTGGTGFLGAHLVRALASDGCEVHVLGRAETDRWRLTAVADRVTHHAIDLSVARERARVGDLLVSIAPTEVFHLAGAPLIGGVGSSAALAIEVNVFGTHAIVEAAAAVANCATVTIGDAFEYTDLRRPLREMDALTAQPASMHGVTRLVATRAAARIGAQTGAWVSTVRLFSVYGPDDDARRLIPRLVSAARSGDSLPLSDPAVIRDWVYVDEVVDLLRRAVRPSDGPIDADDRVFNAGSGIGTTLGELVSAVEALTGSSVDAQWGVFASTEHDDGYWVADPTYTAATLGWTSTVSLADGLERTLAASRD